MVGDSITTGADWVGCNTIIVELGAPGSKASKLSTGTREETIAVATSQLVVRLAGGVSGVTKYESSSN